MYHNTFVSELRGIFTSTHSYPMKIVLSSWHFQDLVETILPCLTGSPILAFMATADHLFPCLTEEALGTLTYFCIKIPCK